MPFGDKIHTDMKHSVIEKEEIDKMITEAPEQATVKSKLKK